MISKFLQIGTPVNEKWCIFYTQKKQFFMGFLYLKTMRGSHRLMRFFSFLMNFFLFLMLLIFSVIFFPFPSIILHVIKIFLDISFYLSHFFVVFILMCEYEMIMLFDNGLLCCLKYHHIVITIIFNFLL